MYTLSVHVPRRELLLIQFEDVSVRIGVYCQPINFQCCPHIETSQLIWTANQLTGFYMNAALAING